MVRLKPKFCAGKVLDLLNGSAGRAPAVTVRGARGAAGLRGRHPESAPGLFSPPRPRYHARLHYAVINSILRAIKSTCGDARVNYRPPDTRLEMSPQETPSKYE